MKHLIGVIHLKDPFDNPKRLMVHINEYKELSYTLKGKTTGTPFSLSNLQAKAAEPIWGYPDQPSQTLSLVKRWATSGVYRFSGMDVAPRIGEAPQSAMWLAYGETHEHGYVFMATGTTEEEAREGFKYTWLGWCESTGADELYWGDGFTDIITLKMESGRSYIDFDAA